MHEIVGSYFGVGRLVHEDENIFEAEKEYKFFYSDWWWRWAVKERNCY